MALAQHTISTGVLREARVSSSALALQPAAWGMAVVEAAVGYEWLLSALNKLFSPSFVSGLADQLKQGIQGNPNTWWSAVASRLVLPNARLVASFTEVGELLVAFGCFAGAFLWASGRIDRGRWGRRLNSAVIAALFGSVVMTLNYYLMSGFTLPGLDTGSPFQEGLDIDGLLTLIGLGLAAVHMLAARRLAVSGSPGNHAPLENS